MSCETVRCGVLAIPTEIIEIILAESCLDHHDITNVAACCCLLREVSNSNELWRIKLHQRWPDLYMNYSRDASYNWKDEFRQQMTCFSSVCLNLGKLSEKFIRKSDIPEDGFAVFCLMLQQHQRGSWFIINSLRAIINDCNKHTNLTKKYYAKKVLQFVQQEYLKLEWHNYLQLSPENQSLEKGSVMVAQWFQTTVSITDNHIHEQLEHLAELVRAELHTTSPQLHLSPAAGGGDVSEIPAKQTRLVLTALNHVLFESCGFYGNEDDYYNCENSYINKVLEKRTGIPISLAIVYISVAKRLGVVCEPVNFPTHFLIKWQEHPELTTGQQYTYIDVFNKGKFLSQCECNTVNMLPGSSPSADSTIYQTVKPAQVFERVARNLISIGRQYTSRRQSEEGIGFLRQAVEFFSAIKPNDIDNEIFRVRLYLYLGINIRKAQTILESLESRVNTSSLWGNIHQVHSLQDMLQTHIEQEADDQSDQITIKMRTSTNRLSFSVGMIMKHKKYDYNCVIYGWDDKCTATDDWIHQMGVHLLSKQQHQPFYNVLVEDGSNRYAAEENLEPHPNPCVVPHPEIGKYFMEYCDTFYRLNTEKQMEYPDDLEYVRNFVQDQYSCEYNAS